MQSGAIVPKLAKIFIYPIKSLDGVAVNQATVLPGGALQHDRELVIVDERLKFVNAKRNAKIHLVRSQFDLQNRTVSLQVEATPEPEFLTCEKSRECGERGGSNVFLPSNTLVRNSGEQVFHLDEEREALEGWFSDFFSLKVKLQENLFMGFPDDLKSTGPTVVSTATLAEVVSWFKSKSIDLDQIRRRFRANLEIEDAPPFWEDHLFTEPGNILSFRIGDVQFEGTYPCQRCPVPTRDAFTGEAYPNFQKIFVEKRKETLPDWATESQFTHFYRLSVNTRIPASEAGKILKVGDAVII